MPAVPPPPRRREWAEYGHEQLDPARLAEWESRRLALRLWVPFALSLIVQLATTFGIFGGRYFGPGARGWNLSVTLTALGIAALAVSAAGPAALLLRRRWPGPIAAVVAALALGGTALCMQFGFVPLYISVLFALAGAAAHGARIWAWASAGAVWLGAAALLSATGATGRHGIGLLVPITVLLALSIAIPSFGRGRRERFLDAQRRAARRRSDAAQAERLRIARELHDVLAHSLSLINVQASVGLHLFEQQPEKAEQALATIKDTSKSALAEVRQVLGVLRSEGQASAAASATDAATDAPLVPEPELSRLGALADEAREQGLEVELRGGIDGAPRAVQSAIYRIVQEALTNVRKHAEARHVVIALDEDDGAYAVSIADDGRGAPVAANTADAEPGNGLLGMRERAELLGGAFSAGPGADGGFAVSARIPKAARP